MYHIFELTVIETGQVVHHVEAQGTENEKIAKKNVWEHLQTKYAPGDFYVEGASDWSDFALVWDRSSGKEGNNPNFEKVNTKGENPSARTY